MVFKHNHPPPPAPLLRRTTSYLFVIDSIADAISVSFALLTGKTLFVCVFMYDVHVGLVGFALDWILVKFFRSIIASPVVAPRAEFNVDFPMHTTSTLFSLTSPNHKKARRVELIEMPIEMAWCLGSPATKSQWQIDDCCLRASCDVLESVNLVKI